ncbi:phage major capsid protein [Mycobacteroides abscessus]|uniref:phage major capsid protein n=1 Tax=Mycobacteroides abscessus TaxID=36809 RepID=UPI000C25E305|nr:phage major capsid protein [Mycobacteroides abscessus]
MSKVLTTNTPKAFGLDVLGLAPEKIIPDSLLLTATTKVGQVEGDDVFVRVPAIDLEADTGFVPEGNDIPEADPDLSELVLATGKIATLVRLSREQLAQEGVTEIVQQEIGRSVAAKVNWALLQQPAPTAPATFPPAGLLAHASVIPYDLEDNLDTFVDAVALIESLHGGVATNVIASPTAWAAVCKFKAGTTSNQSLVGAGVDPAQRTLLGIPVTVTSAMADMKLLVLDRNKTLSAYGNVMVDVSKDAYFSSDSVGIRATIRFGAGFQESDAGQLITVASALGEGEGE